MIEPKFCPHGKFRMAPNAEFCEPCDLLEPLERERQRRREALDELSRESHELGLEY
jgi:hypothetical protein